MLGARYWIHHKLVTATGDSVAGKDEVWVVPSSPSAAVEGTGKFWVVDQAYSVGLSPVFYQFAVSVRCGIASQRTVAVKITCGWFPTTVGG